MTTLSEMIARVRSSFKLINADDVITNRVVANELRIAATKLIKQQTDKRRLFSSDSIFTPIDCLPLVTVPLAECCSYKSNCNISRSVKKLPKIGENIYGPLVQGVYNIVGSSEITYADPERYVNLLKMYPNKPLGTFWWLKNGYLYVTDPLLETVNFLPFFEEFVDPNEFSCYGSSECPINPMDMEFKCPGYLEIDVVNMVREVLLKTYKRSIDDKTVDNNDESK